MSDETFLLEFESLIWPVAEWHHREHVKLAYLYLCRYPFDAAIQKMRASLQSFNSHHNVPETLERGYHETLTLGWMNLVYCTLCEFGPRENADAFLNEHTHLLSRRALRFFYSHDRIMSWEAKRQFVEPDLAPLPRSKKNRPESRAPVQHRSICVTAHCVFDPPLRLVCESTAHQNVARIAVGTGPEIREDMVVVDSNAFEALWQRVVTLGPAAMNEPQCGARDGWTMDVDVGGAETSIAVRAWMPQPETCARQLQLAEVLFTFIRELPWTKEVASAIEQALRRCN